MVELVVLQVGHGDGHAHVGLDVDGRRLGVELAGRLEQELEELQHVRRLHVARHGVAEQVLHERLRQRARAVEGRGLGALRPEPGELVAVHLLEGGDLDHRLQLVLGDAVRLVDVAEVRDGRARRLHDGEVAGQRGPPEVLEYAH